MAKLENIIVPTGVSKALLEQSTLGTKILEEFKASLAHNLKVDNPLSGKEFKTELLKLEQQIETATDSSDTIQEVISELNAQLLSVNKANSTDYLPLPELANNWDIKIKNRAAALYNLKLLMTLAKQAGITSEGQTDLNQFVSREAPHFTENTLTQSTTRTPEAPELTNSIQELIAINTPREEVLNLMGVDLEQKEQDFPLLETHPDTQAETPPAVIPTELALPAVPEALEPPPTQLPALIESLTTVIENKPISPEPLTVVIPAQTPTLLYNKLDSIQETLEEHTAQAELFHRTFIDSLSETSAPNTLEETPKDIDQPLDNRTESITKDKLTKVDKPKKDDTSILKTLGLQQLGVLTSILKYQKLAKIGAAGIGAAVFASLFSPAGRKAWGTVFSSLWAMIKQGTQDMLSSTFGAGNFFDNLQAVTQSALDATVNFLTSKKFEHSIAQGVKGLLGLLENIVPALIKFQVKMQGRILAHLNNLAGWIKDLPVALGYILKDSVQTLYQKAQNATANLAETLLVGLKNQADSIATALTNAFTYSDSKVEANNEALEERKAARLTTLEESKERRASNLEKDQETRSEAAKQAKQERVAARAETKENLNKVVDIVADKVEQFTKYTYSTAKDYASSWVTSTESQPDNKPYAPQPQTSQPQTSVLDTQTSVSDTQTPVEPQSTKVTAVPTTSQSQGITPLPKISQTSTESHSQTPPSASQPQTSVSDTLTNTNKEVYEFRGSPFSPSIDFNKDIATGSPGDPGNLFVEPTLVSAINDLKTRSRQTIKVTSGNDFYHWKKYWKNNRKSWHLFYKAVDLSWNEGLYNWLFQTKTKCSPTPEADLWFRKWNINPYLSWSETRYGKGGGTSPHFHIEFGYNQAFSMTTGLSSFKTLSGSNEDQGEDFDPAQATQQAAQQAIAEAKRETNIETPAAPSPTSQDFDPAQATQQAAQQAIAEAKRETNIETPAAPSPTSQDFNPIEQATQPLPHQRELSAQGTTKTNSGSPSYVKTQLALPEAPNETTQAQNKLSPQQAESLAATTKEGNQALQLSGHNVSQLYSKPLASVDTPKSKPLDSELEETKPTQNTTIASNVTNYNLGHDPLIKHS